MNLAAMETEVYRFLRDTDKTFITSADVRAWINRAQRDIARRTKLLETDTAPAAGATVAIPADYIDIVSLVVGTETVPVKFVDDDYFTLHKNGATLPVEGSIARVLSPGTIEVYPTPTDAYALRYIKDPPDLTADGDESILPPEADELMIEFATAFALYKEGDQTMGDHHMGLYESQLPGRSFGRRFPGPMSLSYESTPLDEVGMHRG